MSLDPTAERPLQVVILNHFSLAGYHHAMAWAGRHGHNVRLLVTSPGPMIVRSSTYRDIIAAAPPEQDILVTTKSRHLAGFLASQKPDLILALGWWYRITPEVIALPRLGVFNIHAAYLPRYRGGNPVGRSIYDGGPLGVTLHRVDPGLDTGPILSRKAAPLPEVLSPENIDSTLISLADAVLEEGLARAIAGEYGEPQNEAEATYALPFTEDETWLEWDRTMRILYCEVVALTSGGTPAHARIENQPVQIDRLEPVGRERPDKPIGTVVERAGESVTIVVEDGVVRVRASPLVG